MATLTESSERRHTWSRQGRQSTNPPGRGGGQRIRLVIVAVDQDRFDRGHVGVDGDEIAWGASAALLEEAVLDPRSGAFVNRDLASNHPADDVEEARALPLEEVH